MTLGAFSRFSLEHAAVVLVAVALAAAWIGWGLRLTVKDRARARIAVGVATLLLQVGHNIYWIGFRAGSGNEWPLHICDLAGFAAVIAFLTGRPAFVLLLYFWGTGLSSLAFVIPVLTAGPATVEFWSFWLTHWIVVAGGVYLVVVERVRPTLPAALAVSGVTVLYGLLMLPVNAHLGANYAYVARESPPAAFLGAWPLPRLPLLAFAATGLILAAYAPWSLWHRGRRAEVVA
ncbi:MAG: TMEM164-related integral membrane acyltransferase [Phycisphaerales bacterium]